MNNEQFVVVTVSYSRTTNALVRNYYTQNLREAKHCPKVNRLEENRGRNRHNVEWFSYTYYISAGQTILLQVQ